MGLFSMFKKNENAELIKGVTFKQCLNDLFESDSDKTKLRRAYAYYKESKFFSNPNMERVPEYAGTVFATMLHYHNLLPQNMDIVVSNISIAACEMVENANYQDPYEAEELMKRLFSKWPKAFRQTMDTALQEQSQEDLFFLCCVHLFGWNGAEDTEKAEEYLRRIGALDEIEYETGYKWLKRQIG